MSYSNGLLYSIYPDVVCINIETLKHNIYHACSSSIASYVSMVQIVH